MATETENQIVVYQPNETVRLDVRLESETVWLTQDQMSMLLGRDQSVIARHIGNIFKDGELDKNVVYAKFASPRGNKLAASEHLVQNGLTGDFVIHPATIRT